MRAVLSVALVIALAAPCLGAPPDPNIERAQKLHEQALQKARRGDWESAFVLWEAAEALSPDWRYAMNQAAGRMKRQEWLLAWQATDRARRHGVPADKSEAVSSMTAQIEAKLLRDHALLELTITPPQARIRIDGEVLSGSLAVWRKKPTSRLRVEHPGYEAVEIEWRHPIGTRNARAVTLARRITTGELVLTGRPAGARVLVDGRAAGVLPRVVDSALASGSHTLRVEKVGHAPIERAFDVKAGGSVQLDVTLQPLAVAPPPPAEEKRSGSSIWGWTAVGLGAALLGTGAGLFVHRDGLARDAAGLSGSGLYDRYDDLEGEHTSVLVSGSVTAALGAALVATGAVLLGLDGDAE